MQSYFSSEAYPKGDGIDTGGFVYNHLRRLGIPEAAARLGQQRLVQKSYELNSIILRRGEHLNGWHFIVNGIVGTSITTYEGHTVSLEVYGPWSWFGEQTIFSDQTSHIEYVCLTDVDVIVLPTELVRTWLISFPEFAQYLSRLMANRMQLVVEGFALQKLGRPSAKVALGLALFVTSLANQESGEYQGNIAIPFSQGLFASLCGVSRTVFSNNVLQLERRNWLVLNYSSIELVNISRWRDLVALYRMNSELSLMASVDEIIDSVESYIASERQD